MTDEPAGPSRRSILSASALGLSAAVGASAPALAEADAGAGAYLLRVVADRAALAAHRETAPGTRVELADLRRRGTFVAAARSAFAPQIAADPHNAFCIVSAADPQVVWLRDYVGPASLDWGGAIGDGVADDASFINAMLANPHVGAFRIEDGRNHFLGSTLRITRPLTLTGAGLRNSVFSVRASIDVISVALASENDTGLHLADFGVSNALPVNAATAGSGIRIFMAWLARLSNIRVYNCWNGIHASQANLTNIDGVHILDCVNAGMLFDGGHNFDTRVTGFTISGGTYAIRLQDMCDEMIFTDGVCSSARWALYTDAAAYAINQRPEFCRFSRVSFDSCANGLDLAHATDFVFDACFISCRPNHGSELGVRGRVENIQFVATTFFNNAKSAAIVGRGAVDTDFLLCKFVSNGTARANTHDTVVFAAGCGAFSLTQNRFRGGWDVASTPRYQVRIEAGDQPYTLMGNRFDAGGAGTLLDQRRAAGRVVAGNSGLDANVD